MLSPNLYHTLPSMSSFHRFTVPGDSVVVTTFEENLIAPLVLGQGRHLSALVADSTKGAKAEGEVDEACIAATKHGWFSELNKAKVRVSGMTLPSCVPSFNLSVKTNETYFTYRAGYPDEEVDSDTLAGQAAANELADDIGLEIKVPIYATIVYFRVL